jgi:hypothetical protein
MYYNSALLQLPQKTAYPHAPAMAAGVSDDVWDIEEVAALLCATAV